MSRPPLPATPTVDASRELLALADALNGEQPPCTADPDSWFAVDPTLAIAVCRRCPATRQCRDYGRALHAETGVYGGVLATPTRRSA